MRVKQGWKLWWLVAGLLAKVAVAQTGIATTTVQDTVYAANGTPASGTVLLSWPAFTTAAGQAVPSGAASATIGAGGLLTIALAPNANATPIGSYYVAIFHLSDGTTSRQYWVVPAQPAGSAPVKLAAIQNQVLPTSVAMQTVSKTYVDQAIAAAQLGGSASGSSMYVPLAGGTMTGPLVLPGDPVSALQAADKNYVDESVTASNSGLISSARLPVFGPSGSAHAEGAVPDPGATAGATRFLREDGSWAAPGGSGVAGGITALTGDVTASGSGPVAATVTAIGGVSVGSLLAAQSPAAVAITGGTLSGTTGKSLGGSSLPTGCMMAACTVAQTIAQSLTASVSLTTLYTVTNAGLYRLGWSGFINTACTGGTIQPFLLAYHAGALMVNSSNATSCSVVQNLQNQPATDIWLQAGDTVKYIVNFNSVTGTPNYTLALAVQLVGAP